MTEMINPLPKFLQINFLSVDKSINKLIVSALTALSTQCIGYFSNFVAIILYSRA